MVYHFFTRHALSLIRWARKDIKLVLTQVHHRMFSSPLCLEPKTFCKPIIVLAMGFQPQGPWMP